MKNKENMETIILRCVTPLLAYILIMMAVEVVVSVCIAACSFMSIGGDGLLDYMTTYGFGGDLQENTEKYSLFITLFTGLISVPVSLKMMKNDFFSGIRKPEEAGKFRIKKWYFIVGLGGLLAAGMSKFLTLVRIDGIVGSYSGVSADFAKNPLWLQIPALVIVASIAEELIFRGLIYNRIKSCAAPNSMLPVYLSALAFGIWHFNLVQGIYGFVLGIFLCFVYDLHKKLAASVLLHISANLTALIMMYLPLSETIDGNIYLKILCMIIELAAASAIVWRMNSGRD